MTEKHPVELITELAASMGGKVNEVGALPDGSGFTTASWPLPKDHWIYTDGHDEPPATMRTGLGEERNRLASQIKAAARYAIRASTMRGREMDFDPDAMVQNLIVGLLGYWTEDGHSHADES